MVGLVKISKLVLLPVKILLLLIFVYYHQELFSHVVNFEVLPFDPLLSDVHSVVSVALISLPMKNDINHYCTDERDLTAKSRTKLKKENKNSYFDTLDASSVFDLDNRLTELASSD